MAQQETMTATASLVRAICETAPNMTAGEGIAHQLFCTHRTEQQNFWRAIAQAAVLYADHAEEFGSDLRNEASVRLCTDIRDRPDHYIPYV